MNQGILATKSSKTQYSEQEAAKELGVSVEELRSLIRSHIAETDEDLNNVAVANFHPSDLLVLKLLSGLKGNPTTEGSGA
ncbi:MAG TPA: hypothetical protein VKX49_02990 [Bryobacteraceae bacterium]|nr:hypothetical protein [Bryobacteraceae bacterium]